MTTEDFAQAMVNVADDMGVSIQTVAKKAPVGFWEKVAVMVDMKNKEAARRYWRKHREAACEILSVSPGNDRITREEIQRLMDAMKEELTELIDAKLEARQGTLATVGEMGKEKPPKAKIGKQYAGRKADIRGLIDLALYELLEADAAVNHNGNVSSCLDKILWNFYGKPELSFQWPEEDMEKRYAKYEKGKKKRRR